jgi:hypothetical protein
VRLRHLPITCGLALAASLAERDASAYCRTTTCDPEEEGDGCAPIDGCPTRGEPLFWPDACVTYAVQLRGSPLREIDAFQTDQVMRNAFAAWLGTECAAGGKPSLGVIPLGGASCDKVEFNPPEMGRGGAPNANLVIFRDDFWPYPDEVDFVIARTSVTFDAETGALLDADIEINSLQNEFSTDDVNITNDLQAVLTHEVGHFLGLDHSTAENATMAANYDLANLGVRTLSRDDQAGICSIYSPLMDTEPSCPGDTGPRHGFSRECGTDARADASCLSLARGSTGAARWAWLALGWLALSFRRRTR